MPHAPNPITLAEEQRLLAQLTENPWIPTESRGIFRCMTDAERQQFYLLLQEHPSANTRRTIRELARRALTQVEQALDYVRHITRHVKNLDEARKVEQGQDVEDKAAAVVQPGAGPVFDDYIAAGCG